MNPKRRRSSSRAFTLIEAVLSMAITAGLLVAALSTLGAMARLERSAGQREVALALAQDLAGEIMQMEYEDPDHDPPMFGGEPDEAPTPTDRRAFDDVDDYHAWVASPPLTRDGDPVAGALAYERRVTVSYAAVDDPASGGGPDVDTGLKRVTIEVAGPGAHASVVLLRSRHGNADREPSVESTYVRWVGVTLQIGEHGHPLSSGTSVLNQIALEDSP